jgi:hypothetical protein
MYCKCECTIPKTPDGPECCHNTARWHVVLKEEFDLEVCFWCDECVKLGEDMILGKISIHRLNYN